MNRIRYNLYKSKIHNYLRLSCVFYGLVFSLSTYSYSQNYNVVLPLGEISLKNNKSTTFQKGDELLVIKQSDKDFALIWVSAQIKKPAVLITDNNEYLYNSYAINDERNICSGKNEVVLGLDQLKGISGTKKYNIDHQHYLYFSHSGMLLEDDSDCSNFVKVLIEDTTCYIGLRGDLKLTSNNDKVISAVGYNELVTNKLFKTQLKYDTGLPVRCISVINYDEYFSKSKLTYKQLIPLEYDRIYQSLKNCVHPNSKFGLRRMNFNAYLEFDNGQNRSFIKGGIRQSNFKEEILQQLLQASTYPFYNETFIKTIDTFQISLTRKNILKNNRVALKNYNMNWVSSYFDQKEWKDVSGIIHSNMNKRPIFGEAEVNNVYKMKYIFYLPKYELKINNEKIAPSISYVDHVQFSGPVNALKSIYPGSGYRALYKDRLTNIWTKITPGIIFVAGIIIPKMISNNYYAKYTNNFMDPAGSRYYNIANVSNRIFFISVLSYASLFSVDFTFTIIRGLKNKKNEKKINQDLNNYNLRIHG